MAVLTISTSNDDEADMIRDIADNLDFNVTVKIKYTDEGERW